MPIKKKEQSMIVTALVAVILTIFVIIFSEEAFDAALEGLKVWWEIVFPSLLPFFIIAEILMGLGVVHFMGALLEPLMRPVFNVPGVGAFAMAMGLASGYPIGAKITANLRRKNLCTKTEGERLVSFTNTAEPLFMIGAVAVGMFHRADLGIIIAGSHYISSVVVGLVLRFYKADQKDITSPPTKNSNKNIFMAALEELIEARRNDGRSLGELLGDAILESINTLFMIGGFIILFSVITKIFIVTGMVNALAGILIHILEPLGFTKAMVLPMISGLFEITNGANLASQAQAPLLHQVIMANAIIAWSGLSVFAQVATMVNGTDIKLKPYVFARILQSVVAGVVTVFLFIPYQDKLSTTFQPFMEGFNLQNGITLSIVLFVSILSLSLAFSFILYLLTKIKIIIFHSH